MNYWDKLMDDDEHAASYMESYGEGPGSDTRHQLFAFVNEDESLLDVGCGPGWNLDHLAEYGPMVSAYRGLDYSERFVRIANKRWLGKAIAVHEPKDWVPGPIFKVGDVRKIEEADNSWDVVILQDVLEHTNGYEGPVKEALRVAKKRVIVTFWRGWRDDETDQINDDGDDGWGATYSKSKWEAFLNNLGYFWTDHESNPGSNRQHYFYIIDKEESR